MPFFQSKLTKKYILITLVVSLLALTTIYIITFHVINQSVENDIQHRNELMAKTISKKNSFILSNIINETRDMSDLLRTRPENGEFIDFTSVERSISRNPLYRFVAFFDGNGEIFSVFPEQTINLHAEEDIANLIDEVRWRKTHYTSNVFTLQNDRDVIAVINPVFEGDLMLGGAISIIDLNTLSQYLNQVKIGPKGINVLIDREGIIIAHSDQQYIGQKLASDELINYLKKSRIGIWEGRLFNETMFFAYRPSEIGNYGLIVGESVKQALLPAREVQKVILQSFLIVVVFTTILTLFGIRRIITPINQLIKQASEYKDNRRENFDIIHTNDELEQLMITMDEMAKELREKERLLFNILQSIPYAVITMDKEGKVITFNRGAENLTFLTAEEAIGKPIIDLPLKEAKEEYLSWKTLKEGKQFNEVETTITDKRKNKHLVRLYSSLFYNEKNEQIGAILILRDVSEMKKLEEYAMQKERLASLGQLTAGIAHEIKNPLSIIQVAAESIRLEIDDQRENEYVQELISGILEMTDRLNVLLTDFLKMAKNEGGFEIKPVNVVRIIEDLITLLRKKLQEHDIIVNQNYPNDSIIVYGNENKLSQVFLNIMLNSIQAMENGGTVKIVIIEEEKYWRINFVDTGKGIPEKDIQWIFTPFYSTNKEGTGLGLAIVYEIVNQLNGEISVESQIGEGTTLSIYLPKQKGDLNE